MGQILKWQNVGECIPIKYLMADHLLPAWLHFNKISLVVLLLSTFTQLGTGGYTHKAEPVQGTKL